jgi:hypothetical protein
MLRRYKWKKAKEELENCHTRRTPKASGLYQSVYHARDNL